MKLFNTNKFKSLLLAGALSLSLFFGGCSSNTQILNTISSYSTTQEKNDNSSASSNSSVPSGSAEASIERVVDGDTMKVKLKDSEETVTLRLLLVDTPESVKAGVDPQPYSIDASNFAKNSLESGDTVYIEYDTGNKTDKYGRHLGYLWFYSEDDNQWEMFNEKIVEKGLARVGYIYSQKRHLDTLYAAQDKAKVNKLNIWSVSGYVTDKGYDVDAYNNSGGTISDSNNNNSLSNSSISNATQSSSNETVYVNGGNSSSSKYHSSLDAHGMKGGIKMTESEAKSKGYEPCKLCY